MKNTVRSTFRLRWLVAALAALTSTTAPAAAPDSSAPAARPAGVALKEVVGLTNPESAVAHADGRIFVTEIGAFDKAGDGKVTVVHPDGRTETLVGGLNDPKGMDLFGDRLYVADVDRVLRIGLDGTVTELAKPGDFPNRPVLLNDIEIDADGVIYVSDSGDNKGQCAGIYAIAPDGGIRTVLGANAGIMRPNGLLLDGPRSLLVADFGTGKLFRLVMKKADGKPALKLLYSGFGAADGLLRDRDGALYVSDWKGGKVWRLSKPTSPPQLITEGHKSSADIGLSADGRYLLMPDMMAGTLVFLPLK